MATKKGAGTAKNLTDSNPKYLGIKLYAGETAGVGSVIVRQRGTRILAGTNTRLGKDHTIFAMKPGVVEFTEKRHMNFNGKTQKKKVAHVK